MWIERLLRSRRNPRNKKDLGPEFCYPKWKTVVLWGKVAALSNEDRRRKSQGLWEEIFRKPGNIQKERPLSRYWESDGPQSTITKPPHYKLPDRGVSQSAGSHPDQEVIRQNPGFNYWHQSQSSKVSFMQDGKDCWWGRNSIVTISWQFTCHKMQERSIQESATPQAPALCGPSWVGSVRQRNQNTRRISGPMAPRSL